MSGAGPALAPLATPGRRRAAAAALLVAVAAAYAPSLAGGYTFDDRIAVADRADLDHPARVLAAVPASLLGGGRGVTDLTFAVGRALHGGRAPAHRAANVAVHLALALLLWALGAELCRRAGLDAPGVPLAAAALWALHPLGSEAVAYVCQRAEALSSLAYAGALLVALRAGRWRRPAAGHALAFALVLLGLGAKGLTVSAFAALALSLAAFPGPGEAADTRAVARRVAPWAAAAALFAAGLLWHLRGSPDAGFSVPALPAADAWRSQGRVLSAYLRLALWPAGQSPDHGLPPSAALDGAALGGWLVVAALAAASAAGLARRRAPGLRLAAFGGAWFLLLLAPTSLLPVADLLAEHRAYLALWGPALAAAALAALALRRAVPAPRRAAAGASLAALALLPLGGALGVRAALWGDPPALWEDAARKAPGLYRPWVNLAKGLQEAGRRGEAVEAWRRAVACWPPARLEEALADVARARALAAAGRPAEAGAALEAVPANSVPAAPLYAELGEAWIDLGEPARAELLLNQAVVIDRATPGLLGALGHAYAAQGRVGEAAGILAAAERRAGGDPRFRLRAARALRAAGRAADACALLGGLAAPATVAEAEAVGCGAAPGRAAGPPGGGPPRRPRPGPGFAAPPPGG